MATKTLLKPDKKKGARWSESHSGMDRIDEEAGVIYGVRVIGPTSRNKGRQYPESMLKRSMPLYEGAQVYVDHDRKSTERSLKDGWAVLRNCRMREGGIDADLHYLKEHPLTPQLIERAKRFPDKFGLSHDASGDSSMREGVEIVESIVKVHSVDIVSNPATNKGLFESVEQTMPKSVRAFLESCKDDSEGRKALLEMVGEDMATDAGFDPGAVEFEMPDDMAEPDALRAAFRSIFIAIIDDESLDIPTMLKKIKIIAKAKEDVQAGASPVAPEVTPDVPVDDEFEMPDGEYPEEDIESEDDMAMQESLKAAQEENKRLKEELESTKLERICESMLREKRVQPTQVRVKALMRAESDAERVELVEQFVSDSSGKARPKSSPGILRESVDDLPIDDIDAMKKRIIGRRV